MVSTANGNRDHRRKAMKLNAGNGRPFGTVEIAVFLPKDMGDDIDDPIYAAFDDFRDAIEA